MRKKISCAITFLLFAITGCSIESALDSLENAALWVALFVAMVIAYLWGK